jgi:capsular exopolysaccharide synthesis family protein
VCSSDLLLQLLDKGFRTAVQFQRQTGLAMLAQIPLAHGSMSMADQVTKQLYSRFSEAIGQLFVAAKLSSDGNSLVKTVLITSALPQEGKTSTAAALARRAALFGEKTLLVDCDFRRPQAGSQLHLKSHKGIAEILAGKALLNEVVQQDEVDKLHFLSCGSNVKDAAVLMRSKAFARLFETLKQHYDFVVIDSSPVLAVVEPLLLAQMVDKCFLLVRWGETPRKAVLTALRQLQDFGIKVDAAIFTQVDTKKQSYYGYGEYGYYSSKMKGYYSQ